jgi:hypothetical protein
MQPRVGESCRPPTLHVMLPWEARAPRLSAGLRHVFSPVVTPGRHDDTPCRAAGRTDTPAIPSLWHAAPSGASEPWVEVRGSRQSPGSRARCDADLELRPLPSTGVTRRPRYCEPVRHPARPGLSLAGVRLKVTRLHQVGLPVLQVSPMCRHAVATTPVRSLDQIVHGTAYSTRFPVHQRRRPSPSDSRVGSHVNPFEACSAFTRVTACRLAAPPSGTLVSKAPTASLPPPPLR